MRSSDARCGTPYVYSGELKLRPELDQALRELEQQPYTAVPGCQGDGRWQLWTAQGDGQTSPRIISGPSTTWSSREAALAAGQVWLATGNMPGPD
ncbi:hypothetical protein ASF84_21500 [Pseudomonas sp. Leaf127]|uniref:hypothetical protein n=1 Tax=Pseudomonas sp. Leaf127 TaxID=1736267 RepID=UPI0007033B09|nr:hypothetical protein [Pseudomonas sp. Leaf127]KQQ50842.1 hypothetical protein ASF84_21500 [Pseudomonas sp. Leaf127]